MDEIFVAEAVYRVTRERRQAIVDLLMYNNVKSMEHYRELMGNLDALNHVEQELSNLLTLVMQCKTPLISTLRNYPTRYWKECRRLPDGAF